MQGQAEFGEPLRQDLQHLFRILPVLKTQDGVIGVSDLVRFPLQPGLHGFLEPFIQDLVQVDIGQKRADWLALAGSCLAHDQLAAVDGPPLIHFPISRSMLPSVTRLPIISTRFSRTIESK